MKTHSFFLMAARPRPYAKKISSHEPFVCQVLEQVRDGTLTEEPHTHKEFIAGWSAVFERAGFSKEQVRRNVPIVVKRALEWKRTGNCK